MTNSWSSRDLYRTFETPGDNKLRAAHAALDTAVRAAYGLKANEDIKQVHKKLKSSHREIRKLDKPGKIGA